MKRSIRISFSADEEATLDIICCYFVENGCKDMRKRKSYDGETYRIDVECKYFSKWHYLDLLKRTEGKEFFFGIIAID